MAQTHALYRFYGSGGTLLYIGITNSIPTRLKQHHRDKEWWLGVSEIRVEHYPTREAVEEAERRAIIAEKPLYNDVHNAAGKVWRMPGAHLAPVVNSEILLVCMGCRNAITEDWEGGLVHIRHAEVHSAQSHRQGRKQAPSDEQDILHSMHLELTDSAGLDFVLAPVACWQVHCRGCNPHMNEQGEVCGGCYAIDAMEIHTWRQLVQWTSHLTDKAWLEVTDWFDMLSALSHGIADDRFVIAADHLAEVR